MFDATTHYVGGAAAGYDAARTTDPKWQREQVAVRDYVALSRPERVLDAPVGTGRFFPFYTTAEVVGLDISADMLTQARQRAGVLDLTLEVADLSAVPRSDDHFDLAICVRLLNLVAFDVMATMTAELSRVSRRHVVLGVRTDPPVRYLTPSQFAYRSRRAGKNLARGGRKVTPHPTERVQELWCDLGLAVEHRAPIDVWPDGAEYSIFLLRVAGATPAR